MAMLLLAVDEAGDLWNLPVLLGGTGNVPCIGEKDLIQGCKYKIYSNEIYKLNKRGRWQTMTFSLAFNDGPTPVLETLIQEPGVADKVYLSSISKVASKTMSLSACSQLASKYNNKINRSGWSEQKVSPIYKEPMLLQKWENRKGEGPWLVSPKMDGIRATYYHKYGHLMSRKRKAFCMPSIVKRLVDLNIGVDGELWSPLMNFEDISSAVSGSLDGPKKDIVFNIFDRTDMPDAGYVERLASLYDIDEMHLGDELKIVQSVLCTNADEVQAAFQQLLNLGYEGAVARSLDYKWEWDVRSPHILKVKDVISAEFICVGIDFDADPKFGNLIAFLFRAGSGGIFKATPAWSKVKRAAEYTDSAKYVGQSFRVDYRGLTNNAVPRHAVVVGLREEGA